MFQFPAFASRQSLDNRPSAGWVVPFGNLRINGHLHLPEAYRSLSRPSSPPRAKASAMRPYLLSFHQLNMENGELEDNTSNATINNDFQSWSV